MLKKTVLKTLARSPFSMLVQIFAGHITQYCTTCERQK